VTPSRHSHLPKFYEVFYSLAESINTDHGDQLHRVNHLRHQSHCARVVRRRPIRRSGGLDELMTLQGVSRDWLPPSLT
jgi:hypothetical protein